jgi:hypothetical protein
MVGIALIGYVNAKNVFYQLILMRLLYAVSHHLSSDTGRNWALPPGPRLSYLKENDTDDWVYFIQLNRFCMFSDDD